MNLQSTKKLIAFILLFIGMSFSSFLQAQTRRSRNNLFLSHSSTILSTRTGNTSLGANSICIKSQNTIGGSGTEDRGAIKTIQGGYITCGSTNSPDGDFRVPANHDFDAYVVKLSNTGSIVWAHTYGGNGYDDFNDIIPTTDGGFIAVGSTSSNGGDVTVNHGGDYDVWVVKLDANGKIQWQKSYGGNKDDHGGFIAQTPNGYAFCAGSASSNDDLKFLSPHGNLDAWIVKISFSGDILFQQVYGGSDYEDADGICFNSADQSIIFSCETDSHNKDVTGAHGGLDAWVVKINEAGNIIWKKTLGGSLDDGHDEMARTSDGNVVMASTSHSFDGDVIGNNGLIVLWLVKLNAANGNIIWNKTFANPSELGAFGILATADGGAVAFGATGSHLDNSTFDALALKVDALGNQEWIKTFGGSRSDYAEFGTEAANGNIITSNYTESNDGDVKKADGGADTWIVALDNCGNIVGNRTTVQKNIKEDFINTLSSYPNPFTNSTTILFSISQSQKVSLKIFDGTGRLVKVLADVRFETGQHELQWNAQGVTAGMYLLQINAGDYKETRKLSVIK